MSINRPITLAFGASRDAKDWRNETRGTVGDFLSWLEVADPKVTEKDGLSFLQGALASGETRRQAKNMATMEVVGFDVESGDAPEIIEANARKLGIDVVIYPTFNDGKPETRIGTDTVHKHARIGHDDEATAQQVLDFLKDEKGYLPSILSTAKFKGRDGREYVVSHIPLPRFRVVAAWRAPVDLLKFPTTEGAKQKWLSVYHAVGHKLGIQHFDESCKDLSRLFFAHRRPKDAKHWAIRTGGAALDFETILAEAEGDATAKAAAPATSATTAAATTSGASAKPQYATEGLARFFGLCAKHFNAADFLLAYGEDAVGANGGVQSRCPNEEAHTELDPPGKRPLWAMNAADSQHGIFVLKCQHQTCQSTLKSGGYADLICQAHGLSVDDLVRDFTDEEGQKAWAAAQDPDKVDSLFVPPETLAIFREMNAAHAFVAHGGKTRFLDKISDPGEYDLPYQFLDAQTFSGLMSSRPSVKLEKRVLTDDGSWTIEIVKKPLVPAWNGWNHRREYRRVVYRPVPPSTDADAVTPERAAGYHAFNLWEGWRIAPKQGSWAKTQLHILEVICRGDEVKFKYVLDHLAHTLQTTGLPRAKSPVSLFVWGAPGAGKSIIFDYFAKLFGTHGITLDKSANLTGNFNKHLQMSLFGVCEEAVYGKDKAAAATLKNLKTADSINIEAKGVDIIKAPNYTRFVFIGNEPDNVPMTEGERRYEVFHVTDARVKDDEWFDGIVAEMESEGGLEAMMWDLLHREIDVRGVRRLMPVNPDRDDVKARVLPPVTRFVLEWLAYGSIATDDAIPSSRVKSSTELDNALGAALNNFPAGQLGLADKAEENNYAPCSEVASAYALWCQNRLDVFERRTCQRPTHVLTREIRAAFSFIGITRSNTVRYLVLPPLSECVAQLRKNPVFAAYVRELLEE